MDRNPPIDIDLNAPADGTPCPPPVITRTQELPFERLTWENFEKLCSRLAGQKGHIEHFEHVARYGRSGQRQHGIDLFVRLPSGKYEVWQVRRRKSMGAAEVGRIVAAFQSGRWKDKSERLVLASRGSLQDVKVQDAIEAQAALLKQDDVVLLPRGAEQLSDLLRDEPRLVDEFFGRAWVESFLGSEAAKALGGWLDEVEIARARAQLRGFYEAHFELLDFGDAVTLSADEAYQSARPSLVQRFTIPDVFVRNVIADEPVTPRLPEHNGQPDAAAVVVGLRQERQATHSERRDYVYRMSLGDWLSDGTYFSLVGDPGSGKSTLLRCIALDVLSEAAIFPQVARRWGGLLPIHVSFSSWSQRSADLRRPAGLLEVISATLQPALTADLVSLLGRALDERRILLLVDGLDEWTTEQAATTTLQHILTFVAVYRIATIVTARPLGLHKLGPLPPVWRSSQLAPLSPLQQRALARVWFFPPVTARVRLEAAAMKIGTNAVGVEAAGVIEARLDRFFAELSRDRHLEALAANPLLLVGLIALSIRQVALPRNRMQTIQTLVTLLLEIHPVRRATAAGDTQPRFTSIGEAEDRRAALARLAFVARSEGWSGSFDIRTAKGVIREYLTDATTFAYEPRCAQSAANELLSDNAETVGLLAKRTSGEMGFVHAVFEEYLAAEHVHRWAFNEIVRFVAAHSGNSRWRDVISNLAALIARPTEVDAIVGAIEVSPAEPSRRLESLNRDILLADIAFNSSAKTPAMAQRLARRAFEVIERGDWMPARREVLKIVLASLGQGSSRVSVEGRLPSWAPRTRGLSPALFRALGDWKPAPDLREVLLRGLYDEDRSHRNSAALALGRVYGGDANMLRTLRQILRSTPDLSVAVATLEALTAGWADSAQMCALYDSACSSFAPALRLAGIAGRAMQGRADDGDRESVVELLSFWHRHSAADLWDWRLAEELLACQWPDDATLMERALDPEGPLGADASLYYLIRCSPAHQPIVRLLQHALHWDDVGAHTFDLWRNIEPFSLKHSSIRALVLRCVRFDDSERSPDEYPALLPEPGPALIPKKLLLKLGGDDFRDALVNFAHRTRDHNELWAVEPLVEGWSASDPVVASFKREVLSWDDEKLSRIAPVLPKILADPDRCRARLLAMIRDSPGVDVGAIARGFAALGCRGEDTEVVDALVERLGNTCARSGAAVVEHFSRNPRVRQYALEAVSTGGVPLSMLARVYEGDAEIRGQILVRSSSLPVPLRNDIVDVALSEVSACAGLERVLQGYDGEVDGELKVISSVRYHRLLSLRPEGVCEDETKRLILAMRGVERDGRGAAAFAGLVISGRYDEAVRLSDQGRRSLNVLPRHSSPRETISLAMLICEHWAQLRRAFGARLPYYLGARDVPHFWDTLAPHVHVSADARREFLAFCQEAQWMLGLRSLMALAREQPSSELLLLHCWRAFEPPKPTNWPPVHSGDLFRLRLEVAYLLRDHFRGRADVMTRLRAQRALRSPELEALALMEPNDPVLKPEADSWGHSSPARSWAGCMIVLGACGTVDQFIAALLEMVNPEAPITMECQDIANRAVLERLQRDRQAVERVKETLLSQPTVSEIMSLSRYLSAAGLLDEEVRERCRTLLAEEAQHEVPRAGYDAVEDAVRAVSASLLEVEVQAFTL
jgi:NACHT domain